MALVPRVYGSGGQQDYRPLLMVLLALLIALAIGVATAYQSVFMLLGGLVLIASMILIFAWPDFPTLLVAFVLYSNAAVVAVQQNGVPYIVGAAVPVILVVPLAYYLIVRREPLRYDLITPLMVVFLIINVIGALFAALADDAVEVLIGFALEGLGIYFLFINVLRTRRMLRLSVWTIILAGVFLGSLTLFQQVTGATDNNFGGFAQVSNAAFGTGEETLLGEVEQARLGGPVDEPNRYAQIMLMLAPIALFRFWGERSRWLRLAALIATALILAGAALTFSRGGAVGFVLTIVVMTLMRYIKLRQLLVVVLVVFIALQVFPQYEARLDSLQRLTGVFESGTAGLAAADGATQSRVTEIMAAALMFSDYPVIGVGPGMYRVHYREYAERVGIKVVGASRQAHSLIPGLAAEYGLLGVGTYLAIVVVMLLGLNRVRTYWKDQDPEMSHLASGFFLAIVTYLTTGLFLHSAFIRFFWLIMAMAGSVLLVSRAERDRIEADKARREALAAADVDV